MAVSTAAMTGCERMLAASRCHPVDCTPVWFMRQAGRCLQEYRDLREKYDILTITRTPELCTQVTLMPVTTFGVDAAVMYADIMLPLFGMGVPFSIDPGIGPIIHAPVRTSEDIAALKVVAPEDGTPDLFTAIKMVRKELEGKQAVIGFAGAPFTLASYLIEGKPTKDFALTKAMMYAEPKLWHQLMERLTEVTIPYLRAQITAGAQLVQLFDSWVGCLSHEQYRESVLPYSTRIFAALEDLGVPTIHFGTNTAHLLPAFSSAGSAVVSVDWRIDIMDAWQQVAPGQGIQGNLDPAVMMASDEAVRREAKKILESVANRSGHIFNLGHGVHAETPPERLAMLASFVHSSTPRSA